jgi:hypothetical protein
VALTGAKKKAFLDRMAKGRRKAKRAKGPTAKKKTAAKKAGAAATRKPRPKPAAATYKQARKAPRKNPAEKPRRRNSEEMEAAERQYTAFHGRPSNRTIEYQQGHTYHDSFAELGRLLELRFHLNGENPKVPLEGFGKHCQVVCTADGSNIYFIGGDQAVDLGALGIESDKDMIELGACSYIAYHTIKGFHDFQPINYEHEFGEEDGCKPTLNYDRLNKTLYLASGNYRVRPAGIEN